MLAALCLSSAALAAFGQTLPSTRPAGDDTPRGRSMKNLRSLMQGVMIYANENRGFVPTDLKHLGKMFNRNDIEATPDTLLTNPQRPELGTDGYTYIAPATRRVQRVRQPAEKLAAYEAGPFGEGVSVAFWDWHVETVKDEAKLKRLVMPPPPRPRERLPPRGLGVDGLEDGVGDVQRRSPREP